MEELHESQLLYEWMLHEIRTSIRARAGVFVCVCVCIEERKMHG